MGEPYGQFGARGHCAPNTPEGRSWMHDPMGGFASNSQDQEGWGLPVPSREQSPMSSGREEV
eukprot:7912153-Karenia_brevis.AAC.1